MSQFGTPMFSEKDICIFLSELGMSANAEQLAKPSFEFVQPIFENLVTALTGVTREELQQPVFMAIDALEFPELHDESIPAMAFIRHLSRLLQAAGVRDFSLKDLYKPEGPRLRRHLSAILNFAMFREEKLAAYTALQEQLEGLLQEKEAAAGQNSALQAQLRQLQEERAAELPLVAELDAERQALYAENQALNKQQAALGGEVRALKQGANALTDEASQLRYKLSQAKGQGELLRSQIVQSPHKIQALLAELAGAVERERAMVADADRRSRELAARLDVVGKVEKEVAKASGLMEGVEAEIGRKKEVSRKVKALHGEISAAEHEAQQLEAQHQHLKRQQAALQERIARLEAQCRAKHDAAESSIEERLRDKEAIEAENAAAAARLQENEATVGEYHRGMEAAMQPAAPSDVAVKPMRVR
ncbi:hypothetical protein CHLNCDRAFT_49321 [Chlorella variabilis]|uniref:Uncharacterized protein n=1 Tax=Chlorella variabilis TaxID=554065 RepID=E1Z1W2_CHLVA|nr:hypothetical protein CHLNCDRAFT_49321 [Chlorella variabilis]EFN59885.1 hypothetical protein CHLNCDRAFT_49321 [Chlorella variabilis]|eukprot:XP_005851987.1 hypothetical protein CHLNCDRAFT_49321 [Chlorella variabilis]